jgi:hypothetical protein
MALTLFALGSVVGTPLAGFLVSRCPARSVLPAALVGSATTLGAVGQASQSITLVTIFLGWPASFLVSRAPVSSLWRLRSIPRPFARLALVGRWASADSALLSDRSPLACSLTKAGASARALMQSERPHCALPCSRALSAPTWQRSRWDKEGKSSEQQVVGLAEFLPSALPVTTFAMTDRSVFVTDRNVYASSQLLLQKAARPAQTGHHGS